MLNNNAVQNESTWKPPTISEHKIIITALITNKKSPNVNIVTGKVKNISSGLIKVLSNANTTAINIDVVKLATVIPDIK